MNTEEISTGTTIMAFKYRDGILLAADSRTSSGSLVSSRVTDKLTELTPLIYCCRSGSAADTQRIVRNVERDVKLSSLKKGKRPSVEIAARMIKNIIYQNRDILTAAILVAGYDDMPRIFKVNICGTITEENIALSGSGSGYAYGFVDDAYVPDMSLEDAIEFAKKVISMAIRRDNFSGGVIRIASIEQNEVKRYLLTGDKIAAVSE